MDSLVNIPRLVPLPFFIFSAMQEEIQEKTKGNPIALLPIAIFLVLYLGLGITFEYILKIPMGFYNIPIVAAFLIAIFVACVQNRKLNFDKKMNVITIDVRDQDPVVAATVADSVRERLQEALTAYRTAKSRHDLAYVQKIQKEAKRDYDRACMLYADFMDSNRDIVLESVRQQRMKLENDMQLRYNNYNALSAQLLAAQAKVQHDTPAFTTLERATVPGGKAGPNRRLIVTLFTVLSFVVLTLWIIFKEGEFKPMFRGLN